MMSGTLVALSRMDSIEIEDAVQYNWKKEIGMI